MNLGSGDPQPPLESVSCVPVCFGGARGMAVRRQAAEPCHLEVTGINGGCVAAWNTQNPRKKVHVGDELLEVNGMRCAERFGFA